MTTKKSFKSTFDFNKFLEIKPIDSPFKHGEYVKLVDGSPRMLVTDVIDSRHVMCSWIDSERNTHEKIFECYHLMPYYTK